MPERWPQVCRVKITFGLPPNNWFVSTKKNSMKYVVNWVLFKRTCDVSGIQFTMYCIEFVCVETNEVVRSNSNIMLTRQTRGHCSSRVAGSRHRALAFNVSMRIQYMFLISVCKGKSNLSVCMTSVLPKEMRPHSANVRTVKSNNLARYAK